jgi:hypothetical protein
MIKLELVLIVRENSTLQSENIIAGTADVYIVMIVPNTPCPSHRWVTTPP